MTTVGRGRGYTGRHHLREETPRPGNVKAVTDMDLVKKLPDFNQRSPDLNQLNDFKYDGLDDGDYKDDVDDLNNDEQALKELLFVDEQYKPLLVLLEQFSPGEDGIQFNRKLRNFETTVTNMCPDEPRLLQAFSAFRAAALLNYSTARKLAAVGASFTRQQRQQLLRSTLLNVVMQGTFSKLNLLERSNSQFLINAANLMGDYFAEARLCNGNKVHILAEPLLQYMKSLLASDDTLAHRSLATQLMQNGRELLTVLSQELDDLSISIRVRMLSPPPGSIIWLLLSADLCLNKFLPLPNILQQFYASHLNLTQETQNPNYNEVNYGSWKKSPDKEEYKIVSNVSAADSGSELNVSTEKVNQSVSQLNLSHEDGLDAMKPKLRPILGAGAGLLRQEAMTIGLTAGHDTFDTWSNKSSLTKRYDLNSWRQNEEVNEEPELVFNPTVLPPNLTSSYPTNITVPDYPPPSVNAVFTQNNGPPEPFPQNYLQQGDGAYIQNQFNERFTNANASFSSQGDGIFVPSQQFQNQTIEKAPTSQSSTVTVVQNEFQTTTNSKKPVENWRKEKSDLKDDSNKTRQKSWPRQRSKDNIHDGVDEEKPDVKFRSNSRSSKDGRQNRNKKKDKEEAPEVQKPVRRHVMDVPRGQKYWDHDDRCDKDYNS